jgi:hypothetical protein
MSSLMVMVCCCLVFCGCLVMMLTRRVLLRHRTISKIKFAWAGSAACRPCRRSAWGAPSKAAQSKRHASRRRVRRSATRTYGIVRPRLFSPGPSREPLHRTASFHVSANRYQGFRHTPVRCCVTRALTCGPLVAGSRPRWSPNDHTEFFTTLTSHYPLPRFPVAAAVSQQHRGRV